MDELKVPKIIDLDIKHEEFGNMFVMETEDCLFLMGTELPMECYLVSMKRQGATIETVKEDIEGSFEQLKVVMDTL